MHQYYMYNKCIYDYLFIHTMDSNINRSDNSTFNVCLYSRMYYSMVDKRLLSFIYLSFIPFHSIFYNQIREIKKGKNQQYSRHHSFILFSNASSN